MKLKKCPKCDVYTMKDECKVCKEKSKDAHYKFIRIKSAEEHADSSNSED